MDGEKDKEKVKKPKAKAKAPTAKGAPGAKTAKPAGAPKAEGGGDGAGKEANAAPAPVVVRVAPPGSTGKVNKAGMGVGSGMMGLQVRERVRKAMRGRGRGRGGRGGRAIPSAPGAAAAVSAPGSLFAAAAEKKADNQDEDVLGFKGQFSKDVRTMMYGFGDDIAPLQETTDLVEEVMLQYLASVVSRAASVASDSLKSKPDERDVLFVVRKDPAKFARVKELLVMQQVIRDARNSFKDDTLGAPGPSKEGPEEGEGADE